MKAQQILDLIIKPTLEPLGLYSDAIGKLLLCTAAQESFLGEYIAQIHGPAIGIFECESATYVDLINNFLNFHASLRGEILKSLGTVVMPEASAVVWNMRLAVIMARLSYLRAPEPIPELNDIEGMWELYKKRYNTPGGAATRDEFMANYNKLVAPIYV